MKRKISPITIILVCVALLCGCANTEAEQKEEQKEKIVNEISKPVAQETTISETVHIDTVAQSNYNNDYLFLESGGWIYGRSYNEKGDSVFVKTRTDLSDWTELLASYVIYPHLVDNYLYFVTYFEDEHGIYRMRTSGEDLQLIVSGAIWLQIVGDTMYYIADENHGFYRCGLDGSDTVEVIAKEIYYPFVFADFIMYQDDADGVTIHVCDLDGTQDKRITDNYAFYPVYDGEYVYYVAGMNGDTKRTIRKVHIDGTDDQEVAPYACYMGFMAKRNYLYFVYAEDGNRLYRMKKDGTGIELITQDENVLFPQFFGAGLKYTTYTTGYEYIDGEYFAAFDGSGKVQFSDLQK